MIARLPDGVECYKRTPSYTDAKVPPALLNDHSAKQGTWGLTRVEQDKLRYIVTDQRRPLSETILTPAKRAVIEPTTIDRVEPLGIVLFHVEFYRRNAE